jgi:hypothetical protein
MTMKLLRVAAAAVLTVGLFAMASKNSEGRPEFKTFSQNGFTFEFNTVPKQFEYEEASFPIKVEGDLDNKTVVMRLSEIGADKKTPLDEYKQLEMRPLDDSTDNNFTASTVVGKKLQRFYYYFEVRDSSAAVLATFTDEENAPYSLRAIGHVPLLVIGSHLLLIFATVFFIIMAGFHSAGAISSGLSIKPIGRHYLAATIAAFLGGYPIGFAMNWYAFGVLWEGVPFGTDATDNKTQLLFLYLIFMMLATTGAALGRKHARQFFSNKTTGWFGVIGVLVMLAVYFIPHSIQFDPTLTKAVGYGWAALMFLLIILGYSQSREVSSV